jgi:diacylglycerol kinase (ATP)
MRFASATVILNPRAGAGRARRISVHILDRLRGLAGRLDVLHTRLEGEGAVLAREAAEAGSDLIVAVGGDGTVNEVVNGLFGRVKRTERKCVLGIVPAGATSSLAKELQIPRGADAVNLIAHGRLRTIDLILMQWLTPQGERKERLATTMAHFGFGGAVARLMPRPMKQMGGFLAFGLVAMVHLLRYKSNQMTVQIEGRDVARCPLFCAIVANSRWEGGGMCVAPQALPDDGLLDIVLIEDLPVPSRIRHFPKVYRGTHIKLPAVACSRGRAVTIRSTEVIPFEFDGEPAECRECRLEVIPQALNVVVPKERP